MRQAFKHSPRSARRGGHATSLFSRFLPLACLLAAAGCNWSEFNDYEKEAPIRVHDAPKNYRQPGYGGVLTAFVTEHTGTRSLTVASAGADSPVEFVRMWNGKRVIEEPFTRCKKKEDCAQGSGVGATLIPFPHWAIDTAQQQDGCVFAPAQGKSYVFCDSDTSANQTFELELEAIVGKGNSAGFSGAALPARHPLGIFLLGAYQTSPRTGVSSNGRIFYQPDFQPSGKVSDDDEVPQLGELPLRDPSTGALFADDPEAGDLGFAMATMRAKDGSVWLAVGQPSRGRVIVAIYDHTVSGSEDNRLTTVACLASPDMNGSFGKLLAMGDVDADGLPEIAVGSDITDSNEHVFVYRGSSLPEMAIGSCPDWSVAPLKVSCSEGVRDVSCADSAFGASLAFGDINADGAMDLFVGAPLADVAGTHDAGAVWVFAGNSGRGALLNVDGATNLFADNGERALLGSSVAALHTKDRDEPVAGAPGEDRLYTFMCSELDGSASGETLCLPK